VNLNTKVTIFFVTIATTLLALLVAISLYAFRSFSIASATEHIQTAGEIVRVGLTESMINGVIDKRENFLLRMRDVHGLKSAHVIRAPEVIRQFGQGLTVESGADKIEQQVIREGKPHFELITQGNETVFRGTIPYIATAGGTPNCMQCHQVAEGTVLGAVSMTMSVEALREKAIYTVSGMVGAVSLLVLLLLLLLRRLLRPISDTAHAVEVVVQQALRGDFKQAIEEDETKAEIYKRLAKTLQNEFEIAEFSLYEISANKKQMKAIIIDGEATDTCRWCSPEILIRPDACRVRRTGHVVDGLSNPDLCNSFVGANEDGEHRHVCFPIIQSGAVGSVVQLLAKPEGLEKLRTQVPFINVYLRESAPVLETKRLMESLRESTLTDAMTGLNNRRFLEEYVETLVASVQRKRSNVAILMLDLDYFKMVNDTYGHDTGDAVLKALAKVLKESVRASDLVIRYGGEEFLIILLDSAGDAADQVAENIRLAVEKLKVQFAGTTVQKTISIGISDFPNDSETFWQAVKFADVALYQAKDRGRNRVIRFSPDMWSDNQTY
jgi:diguanylate cyclase (GGDEF)-like protein